MFYILFCFYLLIYGTSNKISISIYTMPPDTYKQFHKAHRFKMQSDCVEMCRTKKLHYKRINDDEFLNNSYFSWNGVRGAPW